jgi:hypothetical protein
MPDKQELAEQGSSLDRFKKGFQTWYLPWVSLLLFCIFLIIVIYVWLAPPESGHDALNKALYIMIGMMALSLSSLFLHMGFTFGFWEAFGGLPAFAWFCFGGSIATGAVAGTVNIIS